METVQGKSTPALFIITNSAEKSTPVTSDGCTLFRTVCVFSFDEFFLDSVTNGAGILFSALFVFFHLTNFFQQFENSD